MFLGSLDNCYIEFFIVRLLTSTMFNSYSGVYFISLFVTYFCVTSSCLLCIYFYILSKTVIFPGFREVALCKSV